MAVVVGEAGERGRKEGFVFSLIPQFPIRFSFFVVANRRNKSSNLIVREKRWAKNRAFVEGERV